jgi:hypothetical protein
MRKVCLLLLLFSGSFVLTQDGDSSATSQDNSKDSKGQQVTVQGCVGRFGDDYTLTRVNAEQTYQLQGNGVKLRDYLGQMVEVTGTTGASLGTTAPNEATTGSASPITLTVTSVRKIEDKCPVPHYYTK